MLMSGFGQIFPLYNMTGEVARVVEDAVRTMDVVRGVNAGFGVGVILAYVEPNYLSTTEKVSIPRRLQHPPLRLSPCSGLRGNIHSPMTESSTIYDSSRYASGSPIFSLGFRLTIHSALIWVNEQ